MPLAAKAPEFSPPREDWPHDCTERAAGGFRNPVAVNELERLASFLTSNDIAESSLGNISRRETRGSDVSEFKQSESDSRWVLA